VLVSLNGMSCRHTSMVCPSSIGLKRARHTGDRSAQMDGYEVVGTCNNQQVENQERVLVHDVEKEECEETGQ